MVLLSDETPITELDELRPLINEGVERGVLTFDQIAACLEEVEVTKEQVQELHAYLDEHGVEVVESDGRPARSEGGAVEARVVESAEPQPDPLSLLWIRCGCTCGRLGAFRCSPPSRRCCSRGASSVATWPPSSR
jgi:hypothetical protein